MSKDLEKKVDTQLVDKLFPKELEPFKMGVKPAVKVGEKTGEFISDAIDAVVDMFFDDKK